MSRKAGEQLSQAGASPLRVSIGDMVAAQGADTVKREAEAQALANAEAKAEADRKAKEKLGTDPTTAMPSSNPPPPANTAANAFQAALAEEERLYAEQQALEAAEAERLARERAATMTGPIPAPTPTPAPAPAQAPAPAPSRKTFFGNAAAPEEVKNPVQELPLSDFTPWGRFMNEVRAGLTNFHEQYRTKILILGPLLTIASAVLVVTLALDYFSDTNERTAEIAVPGLTVTTVIRVPEPVAVPLVVAPVPPPPPPAEPGVTGPRGRRAIMLAREAFPRSCPTAWSAPRRTDGVTYICGPGERNGEDLCNCHVIRFIP